MYTLTITEQQAQILKTSLEVYARLMSGQASIALEEAFGPRIPWTVRDTIEQQIKENVYPELSANSYYGVGNKDVPEVGETWTVLDAIRYRLAWDRLKTKQPKNYLVDYQEPRQWGTDPIPQIRKINTTC